MRSKQEFVFLLGPLSWLLLSTGILAMLVVLFRPSPTELLIFLAVDSVALLCLRLVDRPIFRSLYPDTRDYFPRVQLDRIGAYSPEQHLELFQSLVRFPGRRAGYYALAYTLTSLPALFVVVYYWRSDNIPLVQGVRALSVFALVLVTFYGAVFGELHR